MRQEKTSFSILQEERAGEVSVLVDGLYKRGPLAARTRDGSSLCSGACLMNTRFNLCCCHWERAFLEETISSIYTSSSEPSLLSSRGSSVPQCEIREPEHSECPRIRMNVFASYGRIEGQNILCSYETIGDGDGESLGTHRVRGIESKMPRWAFFSFSRYRCVLTTKMEINMLEALQHDASNADLEGVEYS